MIDRLQRATQKVRVVLESLSSSSSHLAPTSGDVAGHVPISLKVEGGKGRDGEDICPFLPDSGCAGLVGVVTERTLYLMHKGAIKQVQGPCHSLVRTAACPVVSALREPEEILGPSFHFLFLSTSS